MFTYRMNVEVEAFSAVVGLLVGRQCVLAEQYWFVVMWHIHCVYSQLYYGVMFA